MHDEASSLRAQGVFDAATSVAGAVIGVACPAAAAGAQRPLRLQQRRRRDTPPDGVEKLGDGFWKAAQHDDEASAAADKASAAQHADAAKDASRRRGRRQRDNQHRARLRPQLHVHRRPRRSSQRCTEPEVVRQTSPG